MTWPPQNKHTGWQIAKALRDRFNLYEAFQAKASEVTFQTLEKLQGKLTHDRYFAIFSPEQNTRVVKERRVTAQEERPAVMMTVVASVTQSPDITDETHQETFGSVVDWAHFRVLERIELPPPITQVSIQPEAIEVPSDESLGQLSLLIRHFEYRFLVTRDGELAS